MRPFVLSLLLVLAAALVTMARQPAAVTPLASAAPAGSPQTPAAPTDVQVAKTFTSAADVQVLFVKAKAERKEGQVMSAGRILSLAPYNVNLEYRPVEGAVAVDEKEAEMVYVIEGAGTLTTGGTVLGEKRTNPTNLSGTSIDGGATQTIGKGDFAIIPENTPHQFKPSNGALVLMTFHVPRPVTWPQ